MYADYTLYRVSPCRAVLERGGVGKTRMPSHGGHSVVVVEIVERAVTTYIFFGGMFVFVTFAIWYCTALQQKAQA